MTHRSTQEVEDALKAIPADMPFRGEVYKVLSSAAFEAWEQEQFWEEEGKPHLRTFLKTTLLGGAILELARAINEEAKP